LQLQSNGSLVWTEWQHTGSVSEAATWRQPTRLASILRVESSRVKCDFNMAAPIQWDAAVSLMVISLIIICMLGSSLLLTVSATDIVQFPVGRIIGRIKTLSGHIFSFVDTVELSYVRKSTADGLDRDKTENTRRYSRDARRSSLQSCVLAPFDSQEASRGTTLPGNFEDEINLLTQLVDKVSVVSEIMISKGKDKVSDDELAFLGRRTASEPLFRTSIVKSPSMNSTMLDEDVPLKHSQMQMMSNVGLSIELFESWNMNPLELDNARCFVLCEFMVSMRDESHGTNVEATRNFLYKVEGKYNRIPYHSWFHAVDVTHCTFRLLDTLGTSSYLSSACRFSLIISALAHDVGHPGMNNQFLIETGNELALRYNDRSPLENLHCTTLFGIVRQAECDVFQSMSRAEFLEARKVAVECILHTDPTRHFAMIQDLEVFQQLHVDIMDDMKKKYRYDAHSFPSPECIAAFRSKDTPMLISRLLLHASDISNCCKPFRICRIWAKRCLDEFFLQGDKEFELGLPVSPMNDREKVNTHLSQLGFIEYLVAPMSFLVVKVFPPYVECARHLVENMLQWEGAWKSETRPPPQKEEKDALQERVGKFKSKFLAILD